nr:MAG TPA: hypothetical protein [Caudoviricetes sp.]
MPYGRGQNLFDFFRTVGRCKKSHRLAAHIVGCLTLVVLVFIVLYFGFEITSQFIDNGEYNEISIRLFGIVQIEGSR